MNLPSLHSYTSLTLRARVGYSRLSVALTPHTETQTDRNGLKSSVDLPGGLTCTS
jgi:hypothetical protein